VVDQTAGPATLWSERAGGRLDVFMTKAQSLDQQNLNNAGVSVIVLVAPGHDVEVMQSPPWPVPGTADLSLFFSA